MSPLLMSPDGSPTWRCCYFHHSTFQILILIYIANYALQQQRTNIQTFVNHQENMSDTNQSQQPSLVAGHAQYVKGQAEAVIGNVTGSEAWKASGEQDKAAGQATMQKAGEQRDPSSGYGKVEELAGKATGCEGMQREGAESKSHNE
ncbi:hypothetical protein LMH87_011889 [Akanthomyces muscarius]|uniref:CsbD-like domain-containing protein n=1 Tax=Akanthomyces muscarius TaxID=2231603 RepID=A0A9W8UL83_AKAMU|nr:hypothetical protein LMH87_011889 [Akanthomyces muscarius]KAJ4151174.1 hypothetical protein LMH87_011889 [Akanthomyces muscarius]